MICAMAVIIAMSEAVKTDLALIGIFGILFPALVTGLIVFAAAQSMAERAENVKARRFRRR
jgi:site-specific recombinase